MLAGMSGMQKVMICFIMGEIVTVPVVGRKMDNGWNAPIVVKKYIGHYQS